MIASAYQVPVRAGAQSLRILGESVLAATLLAVDDSATMRKVVEMTLAGEDIRVVTADSADAALSMIASEKPAIVVTDISMPGKNGYELCAQIKRENPALPVLLLSSKFHPYEAAKGTEAKADGYIDKPFDTQKFIDKIQELLKDTSLRAAAVDTLDRGAVAAAVQHHGGAAATGPSLAEKMAEDKISRTPTAGVAAAHKRQPTLIFSGHAGVSATRGAMGAGSPSALSPKPPQYQPRKQPPPPVIGAKPGGPSKPGVQKRPGQVPQAKPTLQVQQYRQESDIAKKLGELGLNANQIDGVLAVSREIVERVVWEVVPVMAETIIKEEIKRLMEDGGDGDK